MSVINVSELVRINLINNLICTKVCHLCLSFRGSTVHWPRKRWINKEVCAVAEEQHLHYCKGRLVLSAISLLGEVSAILTVLI